MIDIIIATCVDMPCAVIIRNAHFQQAKHGFRRFAEPIDQLVQERRDMLLRPYRRDPLIDFYLVHGVVYKCAVQISLHLDLDDGLLWFLYRLSGFQRTYSLIQETAIHFKSDAGNMPVLRSDWDLVSDDPHEAAQVLVDRIHLSQIPFHWSRCILKSPAWYNEVVREATRIEPSAQLLDAPTFFALLRCWLQERADTNS